MKQPPRRLIAAPIAGESIVTRAPAVTGGVRVQGRGAMSREHWRARVWRQWRLARLIIEDDPVGWLELSLAAANLYFGLIWMIAILSPALVSPALVTALPGGALWIVAFGQMGLGGAGLLNLGGHLTWRMSVAAATFLLDWALLLVLWGLGGLNIGVELYFALQLGAGLLLWRMRRSR